MDNPPSEPAFARFYRRIEENARNPQEPALMIIALGDSVTQGVTEHRLREPAAGCHRELRRRLEEFFPTTTFNLLNAGVGGQTAGQGLARLERDVISHRPDLVIIGFGLNDAVQGIDGLPLFEEALARTIGEIRERTSADLVLMTPPFMATRHSFRVHPGHDPFAAKIIGAQNDGTLAAYAGAIRKLSARHGVPLADVYAEWARLSRNGLDTDLWLVNGLNHPGERGHRLAATVLFRTVLSGWNPG